MYEGYEKDLANHYTKGHNNGYDFDLQPLIQDFSFYIFCSESKDDEHGAFLVITNRQYILGYNPLEGRMPHSHAFARCMKDISGGGYIKDDHEGTHLQTILENKYLCARIVYETYEMEDSHRKQASGYITFIVAGFRKNKVFTYQQYDEFMKFYADYNEEIKRVCNKFNFVVSFVYYNESGKLVHVETKDLEAIRLYLHDHLVEVNDIDDEVILKESRTK